MRTRSSSNLLVVSSNPLTSNPKRRNRRRSKQPFILEESPIDTMADQRTMAELLRAPTEGYAEAIVVPSTLADQFELKHSLINMMTTDQFFRLEKDNPHDHIRAARRWLEKEPPHSIHTWEDLAWDRYKYLLRACPHYGFIELHQLDTFYNALNPADQDSLNAAAGGNLLFLAAGDITFLELWHNIQGYVSAAAVNYNQGNSVYRPPGPGSLPSNTIANPKGELKAITTRSGIILDGPITPPLFIHPEEDERVEETLTDPDLSEHTIKLHINITLAGALIRMPKYQKMLKSLLSNKEKLQELANTPVNENCSVVILKKLLEKLGVPGKFLISCRFIELKCTALADLGASINLMPLSVWKKLGLPKLISTYMILELANRAICTPAGIAKDVFIPVGKFTFPADFVIVDYESDPRKESINLINVFNNSNEDFIEDLFSNQPSDNPTFSFHPELTSPKVKNDIIDSEGINVLPEKLLDHDFTKDLHALLYVNPLSGSTTYSFSSNPLLEEFTDELALITFPLKYDDDL
nr:reverse transcriptase domain-containing protein [Tanacetum cinerariifolium]